MTNLSFVPENLQNLVIILADIPQPNFDGGVFEYLFDSNLTFGGNNSDQYWLSYASQAIHKGTYIFIIVLGLLWAVVLPSLYISLLCCFHRNKSLWAFKFYANETTSANSKFESYLTKLKIFLCSSAPRKIRVVKRNKLNHYKKLICIVIFLIISFIFCCMMLASNGHFNFILQSKTDSSSIKFILSSLSSSIEDFISNSIESFRSKVLSILNESRTRIQNFGYRLVSSFIDQLLDRLEINNLFSAAETLFQKFNLINNSTMVIISQKNYLTKNLAVYDNNLKEFRDSFKRLPNICSKLPVGYTTECMAFQKADSDFYTVFSPDNIDIRPAEALLTMLDRFKINLTQIERELFKAKDDINKFKTSITDDLTKLLSEETLTSVLDPILLNLYALVSPITNELNSISQSESTERYLSYLSISRGVLFVLPGAMFLFIFLVICFFIYKSIVFFKHDNLSLNENNSSETYIMKCLEEGSTSSTKSNQGPSLKHFHSHKLSRPCLHCGIIVMSVFIIISTLGIMVFFIVGSLIQTEACRYFTVAKGVNRLDVSIDNYVSDQWSDWMHLFNDLSKVNITSDTTITIADYVSITKPNHPYGQLLSECQRENVGILDALGIHDVINVKKFIYSPIVDDLLKDQKAFVKNEVRKIDTNSLLAGGSEILQQMEDAKRLTRDFIDTVDHTDNIKEASKPIMNLPDPASYFQRFSNFMEKIKPYLTDFDDLSLYFRSIQMNNSNSNYRQAVYSKDFLVKNNLKVLQNERNMTARLVNLTVDFNKVSQVLLNKSKILEPVGEIYDSLLEPLKNETYSLAAKYVPELERSLIPCHKIVTTYQLLEKNICTNFNQEFNSFNIVYIVFIIFFEVTLLLFYFHLREVESCCCDGSEARC